MPPAAIAVTQDVPAYHQVVAQVSPPDGYFPLTWWAGLAVYGVDGDRTGQCRVRVAQEGRMSAVSHTRPAGLLATALHAEWTKVRTLPGMIWLLAAGPCSPPAPARPRPRRSARGRVHARRDRADPAKISLTGIYLGQVLVAVLAVLAVGGESATGWSGSRSRRYRAVLWCCCRRRSSWPG